MSSKDKNYSSKAEIRTVSDEIISNLDFNSFVILPRTVNVKAGMKVAPPGENTNILRLCRFGMECKRPDCYFAHIAEYEDIKEADLDSSDLDLDTKGVMCKLGASCQRPYCQAVHPEAREDTKANEESRRNPTESSSMETHLKSFCKNGPSCQRVNCPFLHSFDSSSDNRMMGGSSYMNAMNSQNLKPNWTSFNSFQLYSDDSNKFRVSGDYVEQMAFTSGREKMNPRMDETLSNRLRQQPMLPGGPQMSAGAIPSTGKAVPQQGRIRINAPPGVQGIPSMGVGMGMGMYDYTDVRSRNMGVNR